MSLKHILNEIQFRNTIFIVSFSRRIGFHSVDDHDALGWIEIDQGNDIEWRLP